MQLLEAIVKNCDVSVHREIGGKKAMAAIVALAEGSLVGPPRACVCAAAGALTGCRRRVQGDTVAARALGVVQLLAQVGAQSIIRARAPVMCAT